MPTTKARPRYSLVSIDEIKVATPEVGLESDALRLSSLRRGHKLNHRFIRPGIREAIQNGGAWEVNVDGLSGVLADGQTVPDDSITFAKMQEIATNSIVGRDTAGTGNPETILLNATLEMDGSQNLQRAALTGDVTSTAGSNSTTIPNNTVTYAKMQDVSAASKLVGRGSAGGSGDPEEITLGTGLSMSSTTLNASTSGDIVYVGTPADTDVASVTDIQIVSRDVTSVGATDQLIVEGSCTFLNNSIATKILTFTIDFDAAFDVEMSTGALTNSTTDEHVIFFKAHLSIRSTSLAYATFMLEQYTNAAQASGADPGASAATLRAQGWGTTGSNLSSTTTVTLHVRSTSALTTQTLKLHTFTIRKVTPT